MSYMPEDDQAQIAELLRLSGYPEGPITPAVQQSPDMRVGRFRIPGQGLDAAALGVLASLQRTRPAKSGLGQFAEGFAQSYAMKRARGAQQRAEQNQQARASALEMEKERRGAAGLAARQVVRHKQRMAESAAKASDKPMFELPDGTKVPMTAAIASGLAVKGGAIPARAEVGVRPKIDDVTRAELEVVADAIVRGDASPDLSGGAYGRDSNIKVALTAMLDKRGFKTKMQEQKYNAEKTFLRSANGTIALRGMRNVVNARESLDYVETLLDESIGSIPRSRFTIANRALMTAAAEGMYGPEAAASARKLRAQVAAVRFELSNIYMGGTAPTDQAVKKAMDVIDSNWSEAGLRGAIALARRDLGIRVNAIKEVGPISLDEKGGVVGAPQPGGFPSEKAEKNGQKIDDWLKEHK